MAISAVSRRAALSAFGALSVFSIAGLRRARAQTALRLREIQVDVWRLRASAGDQTADWVEEELPKDLARALAPYMAPGERNGATLLARIENVDLGGGGTGRGGGSVDSIEGVLIVSGSRGLVAAATPLRATAPYEQNGADQPLFEEAYHSRVIALADAFAGWAPGNWASETAYRVDARDRLPWTPPWYSAPTMVGAGTDRTKPQVGGGPAVILVRPQLAVNIGMCARAMANFGLDDLRLVNPREGWPRSDDYRDVAYSAAAGATDLLDAARVFASVEAAVGDLHAVYATTARERGQMKAVLSPSAAMGATAAAIGEKRGILFGPERTGLDNDEVALADCDRHLSFKPRLRLAQPLPGGPYVRLRMVQGGAWRQAPAADDPPPRRRRRRSARCCSPSSTISRAGSTRTASSGPRPRSRACGETCATSSIAWS